MAMNGQNDEPRVELNLPSDHPHCLSVDRVTRLVAMFSEKSMAMGVKGMMTGDNSLLAAGQALHWAARMVVAAVASNEHEPFEEAIRQLAATPQYEPAADETQVVFPHGDPDKIADEDDELDEVDESDEEEAA
jgi:hypothetical protein